jgi:DNA polymerase-1
LWSSYWQEEAPLVTVLVAMEQAGVRIDPAMLEGLTAEWMASEARLEAQIIDLAGESFNVGSPKQWGEILQKQPGVRLTRKTKQGSFGTSADILEDLADEGVEIARLGLEWRQLRKLSSTYGRPLVEHADPVTHRLHSQLSQSSTATGRLSSSHPNLQNLPVRSGEGRAIRRAIVASPGTCLLAADYSQIELRILAYVARIPSMMEALRRGEDLHRQTASALYRIAVDEVSEVQRRVAKTVNFGIIYGITAFGLAKQLKVERSEAQWLIDRTAELYPELRVYQERVLEEAHRTGWVRSVDGRRHGFRVDHRTAHHARQFAERSLINATIQGVAATWMKRAMIALDAGLRAQPELGARMVLQIHDELLFEVAEDRVMPLAKLVDGAMRNVTREDIPLVVDLRVGSDWGSATPWLLSTD